MKVEKHVYDVLRKEGISAGMHCLLALSGGGDSVALLSILSSIRDKLGIHLSAARVVHGIRGQAEEETETDLCIRLCAQMNVRFSALAPVDESFNEIMKRLGCGPEQAARELRQTLIKKHREEIGADFVLYGHTADDRLETIFMRLLSGSGPEGLSGISLRNKRSLKPMLGILRSELRTYLYQTKTPWAEDSSNDENIYRRNRVRNELIPLISEIFPGWSASLDTLGERSREAADLLDTSSDAELPSTLSKDECSWSKKDWDSASEYSRALALWKGFNSLDNSGIPDHRFPWRRLKEARRAINEGRVWNGPGLRLEVQNDYIVMTTRERKKASLKPDGRIVVSRNEARDSFRIELGGFKIHVCLDAARELPFCAYEVRNWPIIIKFGRDLVSVTEKSSGRDLTDADKELVYIFIEPPEEGSNARQ